jgi:phosphohistidine phosphatase SixA
MSRVYFILIRHGERVHDGGEDDSTRLTEQGRMEIGELRDKLAFYGFEPAVYFTSTYAHAIESGQLLAERSDEEKAAPVIELNSLKPGGQMDKLNEILMEASNRIDDLESCKVMAFIGHEPSMSQLLTRLTSKRFRNLNRAEAVCVEAESLLDFCLGKGKVCSRIPIVDYQEDQLRSKISSKLAVATFLAGFTFAALVEILLANAPTLLFQRVTNVIAIVCLTAAAAMFIAAVYMYDRLGMPEGFWAYGDRPKGRKAWSKEFEKNLRYHGPLYAHMLWVWNFVFTPAVVMTLIGFMAILLKTGDKYVIGLGSAVLVAVSIYYWWTRPRLGSD